MNLKHLKDRQRALISCLQSIFFQVGGATLVLFLGIASVAAQELEPRRWSHLPKNINILGVGYGYSEADIAFDPALQLEDVKLNQHTVALKYIRTFELLGKSARIDLIPIFEDVSYKGLLKGEPAQAKRSGLADPIIRFAVNLLGAPPLERKEYREYRQNAESETIVGLALAVHLPLGQYYGDKLLNLGENRFIFRPQLGAVHSWGAWSAELTGSIWFYTDDDEFYNGLLREQDPFYTLQSQVVYSFSPGIWAALSAGYGIGAESTIDGVSKNDQRQNIVWAASFGFPLTKNLAGKIVYIGVRSQEAVGADSDTLSAAMVVSW